jgi:Tfp pilus assembly protein PilO
MERLNIQALRGLGERLAWELHRGRSSAARHLGLAGTLAAALAVVVVILLGVWFEQQQLLRSVIQRRSELAQATVRQALSVEQAKPSAARDRLHQFESHLLAHDDIPSVVEDVLRRAEDEGLSIQRGDYRPQADLQGGFMRYRMSLPVAGKPAAIHRFIQAVLVAHRSLALQSIHFGRERMEAGQIEARLQWSLLTRLPADSDNGTPGSQDQR